MAQSQARRKRRSRPLGEVASRAQQQTDELQLALLQGGIILSGIALLGGGSYYLVSKAIREGTQNRTERAALGTGVDPGTFVLQLHTAMNPSGYDSLINWDTTDVPALLATVRSVPSKTVWREVVKQYEILYKRALSRDVANELSSEDLNRVIALIKAMPEK